MINNSTTVNCNCDIVTVGLIITNGIAIEKGRTVENVPPVQSREYKLT